MYTLKSMWNNIIQAWRCHWLERIQLTSCNYKKDILTLSSLSIDKQTVPDGYTLGWKKPWGNLHFGGLLG